MAPTVTADPKPKSAFGAFGLMAVLLFAILMGLFWPSLSHDNVIFSNDGPLGAIIQKACAMPSGFRGCWADLTWIGGEYVSARPTFTCIVCTLLQPLCFARFACPIVFFVLGVSAWLFFRQLKLVPAACIIAGLAAGLDGDFFSTGCWGVVAQPVCFASSYLALAALADLSGRRAWVRVMLAGFAVGHGVMEGYDIGAIFSLFVAAYVLFQSWNVENAQPVARRFSLGLLRLGVVVVFAGFISVQTVDTLVHTQIKDIVGAAQDEQTRNEHWGEATMWSVPKKEALGIVVPGLFGYRMDTGDGGNYWGAIGEHWLVPEMQKQMSGPDENARKQAAGFLGNANVWRFSGSGIYAGVLVVLVACWAVAQSFRRKGSPFPLVQRRSIRFWTAVTAVGLLMGFGKYAPFFRLFYDLPYASTMRNPFKFMHIFHWALIILFAYGLHGLFRAYMQNPVSRAQGLMAQFKSWRARATLFERNWFTLCLGLVGIGLLAFLLYASSNTDLEKYLQTIAIDHSLAPQVAQFSLHALGWSVLFLTLSVVALGLIFSGQFSGPNAKWGAILLGAIVVADLGRADLPWIVYWNYPYKYASNPIIDILRAKPYEYRVTAARLPWNDPSFPEFEGVYGIEWTQQIFLYYNIQCLDVIMEPRETVDNSAFRRVISALNPATLARHWQLTNTRYIFAPGNGAADVLNQYLDPVQRRFRVAQRFDIVPKKDIPGGQPRTYMDFTAQLNPAGQVAMIEFTGALPRVRLYSNWQVDTNGGSTLATLADPAFDPLQTVVVGDPIPGPAAANTNQPPGTAEINPNYEPKRVEITADAKVPSVLLFNDKYNQNWHVTVDGKPVPLLRCNFVMRGVSLQPGKHDVVFQYTLPETTLYLSIAAVVMALGLCLWLVVDKDGGQSEGANASPASTPPANQAK